MPLHTKVLLVGDTEFGNTRLLKQLEAWHWDYVLRQSGDVDRTDRRDLSVFRLGWDFIERRLVLDDPLPLAFIPNFCSVSGN